MNRECEALVDLYGALQECTPQQQAEKKKAFDSALWKFCGTVKADPMMMRAFVSRKWHALNKAEAKRKGADPKQGQFNLQ